MALLSIIIPTRNRAEMLRDTPASLPVACIGQEQVVGCLAVDNGQRTLPRSVVASVATEVSCPVREYT